MRTLAFADRNSKEILRDVLNLAFGLGFPVVLLLLLTAIQANVPVDLFRLDQLTPGMAMFGLSFISLFSGTLIAKDRSSSLMMRLFTSPMKARDFILGYTLPLLPMAIAQVGVCFGVACLLGLTPSWSILTTLLVLIPAALLFIAIGLLCGTIFNDKQVGSICGALLTNLSAWLSGTWFDLNLVGDTFKKVANLLPFSHAVNAGRAALAGNLPAAYPELVWVSAYAIALLAIAILVFTHKMDSDRV
ncbi:ABC transporter permease [Pelolinea submarina]|uniref:Transport permease protein n=1 Tax=Pelolinea submarina TaxID=913107 RepID=A0A347ZVM7_9CHLR|nr:ABC transporter permease [Pelolinea submarina]REG07053.1 ABC-2 type transport system permease protein [Pelolinea submarina]BBB49358.1 ABC-2 type transport system permease protein [Pelolinea submarina]